ncbi:hypothetical protein LTR10_003672 [Elasticomyces elasticus]|nr:hypothetical protein LTR10_003672 [Elasticomyces elasticus]KAK4978137.1 hypothetical protein LTR42_002514 [Elasticomyces elasticus]
MVMCIIFYEADRRKTHDTPLVGAWVPCLAQALASIVACVSLIVEPSQTCGTTLNADIGGSGVLVGIYFPALLAIISLAVGHCHTREAGTKEIGVVLLANLVYLTFNLVKATTNISGLTFEDAIIALLSIDATCTALSATLSNKDALAARTYFGLCALAQLSAGIAVIVAVARLEIYWHEHEGRDCCTRLIWWATWTSCDMPGPNIWIYTVLSAVTRGYDVVIAFRLAPKLDQLKKETEGKKANIQTDFEEMISTCLTRYIHHVPSLVVNFSTLATLFYRMGLTNASKWSDWGQSATLITCVSGTCHWLYVCTPLLNLVDERAELTGLKSRWSVCARTWLCVNQSRRHVVASVSWGLRSGIPQALRGPKKTSPERSNHELVLAAKHGDMAGGADINWYEGSPTIPTRLEDFPWTPQYETPGTALTHAIQLGNGDLSDLLLSLGAKTSWHSEQPLQIFDSILHLAARNGQLGVAEEMLDRHFATPNADVVSAPRDWLNYLSKTPFECAFEEGHYHLLETLAPDRGTDSVEVPRRDGETFYVQMAKKAVIQQDLKGLFRLWQIDGMPRKPQDFLDLIELSVTFESRCAKALLSMYRLSGWDESWLPVTDILTRACKFPGVEYYRWLCSLSDINQVDKLGRTALHTASSSMRPDLVTTLLKAGATPDAHDKDGKTPLHRMMDARWSSERIKIAKLLIEAGADINARNTAGLTPLFFAMAHRFATGQAGAVKFLLRHGAIPLSIHHQQRLASVMFDVEFDMDGSAGRIALFDPRRDSRVTSKGTPIARRRSLNDGYRSDRERPLLKGHQPNDTPLSMREHNWANRVWAHLRPQRTLGILPWGYTAVFPWLLQTRAYFSGQSDSPPVADEEDLPTLTGIYRGGLDFMPTKTKRERFMPYVLRQLDRNPCSQDLLKKLVAAPEKLRALDLPYDIGRQAGCDTAASGFSNTIYALDLARWL